MFDSDSDSDDSWIPEMLLERPRRPRTFKPRINFDLPPTDNRARFRLLDRHVESIVRTLSPFIAHDTDRNFALNPEQQIRLALRYLASGSIYQSVVDSHGIHKSTVSRTLHRVVDAVNYHLLPEKVRWPQDPAVMRGIVQKFRERANFPAVFGCIDGTYINLIRPSVDEHQYVDRHQNHSINCMVVCGPNLEFFYVSTRWPGSVGDGRVFRQSPLFTRLEAGWRPFPMGILLGDKGYTNFDYLITPLRMTRTQQEERFNTAHRKTRNMVECAIGLLKQRFRCLLTKMHFKPEFVGDITRCCVALHNIVLDADDLQEALRVFDIQDPNLESEDESDEEEDGDNEEMRGRRGQLVRLF